MVFIPRKRPSVFRGWTMANGMRRADAPRSWPFGTVPPPPPSKAKPVIRRK